jgi:hypothetical protein
MREYWTVRGWRAGASAAGREPAEQSGAPNGVLEASRGVLSGVPNRVLNTVLRAGGRKRLQVVALEPAERDVLAVGEARACAAKADVHASRCAASSVTAVAFFVWPSERPKRSLLGRTRERPTRAHEDGRTHADANCRLTHEHRRARACSRTHRTRRHARAHAKALTVASANELAPTGMQCRPHGNASRACREMRCLQLDALHGNVAERCTGEPSPVQMRQR